MKIFQVWMLVFSIAVMSACGGGEDTSNPNNPDNPTNPDNPIEPNNPIEPDNPENPDTPDEPQIPQANNISPLKHVAISDAVGLIITDNQGAATSRALAPAAPTLANGKSASTNRLPMPQYAPARAAGNFDASFEANSLYKVLPDGTMELVELTTADNESLRGTIQPRNLVEMGNGWVLIFFDSEYEYVLRQGKEPYSSDEYWLASAEVVLPYLVHQQTGTAYAAPWATSPLIISDLNNDGLIEIDYYFTGEFVSTSTCGGPALYREYPAAQFDDNGDMYVIGCELASSVDRSKQEQYEFRAKRRIYKVDTSNAGAETLTVTQIQRVDLDSLLATDSLVVSADGKLMAYQYDAQDSSERGWRVSNLAAGSNYALNSVVESADVSAVLKGQDGSLYTMVKESLEWTPKAPAWGKQEFFATVVYELMTFDLQSKPSFNRVNILNSGKVSAHDGVVIASLEDWDALPGLLAMEPIPGENWDKWHWETIYPITNSLRDELGFWVGYKSYYSVNGKHILIDGYTLNGEPRVNRHYILDLANAQVEAINPEDLGFNSYTSFAYNTDSLFFFGKDDKLNQDYIARWTPSVSQEVVEIPLDVETFDVKRFKVLTADTILFEAVLLNPYQGLSTGDRVLAEANFAGNVTITNTISADAPSVLIMERISQTDFIVVDGKAYDWPIEYRTFSDAVDDEVNYTGADLHYLSHTSNSDYHWFLVELNKPLGSAYLTLTLTANKKIVVSDQQALFVDNDVPTDLFATGGIYAVGNNLVEFRINNELLAGESLDASINSQIDGVFGGATVTADVTDSISAVSDISVVLTNPVGPTTLTIDLVNDIQLQVNDSNWNELDANANDDNYEVLLVDTSVDPQVEHTLASVNASYSVIDGGLSFKLPPAALKIDAGYISIATDTVDGTTGEAILALNLLRSLEASNNVEITLLNDRVLSISDDSLADDSYHIELIDQSGASDVVTVLADAGGSYSVTNNVLTVTFPATALAIDVNGTIPTSIDASVVQTIPASTSATVSSVAKTVALPVDH